MGQSRFIKNLIFTLPPITCSERENIHKLDWEDRIVSIRNKEKIWGATFLTKIGWLWKVDWYEIRLKLEKWEKNNYRSV